MPIAEIRVRNFRLIADKGVVKAGGVTPIAGKKDLGESGLLNTPGLFFEPPKKGGIHVADLHGKDENVTARVEISFKPSALITPEIQVGAKNKTNLSDDAYALETAERLYA